MKTIATGLSKALKAIYAGAGALLTGLGTALVGADKFSNVTDAQWIVIASLTLTAFGAVYGVTNKSSDQPAAK